MTAWWSAIATTLAAAHVPVEETRDRPGLLALLVGSLMLVTWAVALGITLRRARRGRRSP